MLFIPAAGTVVLACCLGLWPVPIDPVGWEAPTAPGYTGAHAANSNSDGLRVRRSRRELRAPWCRRAARRCEARAP